MLDAGTLVCNQSSSRKRVSSDWANAKLVLVCSQDHSLQEPGLSLVCRVESRRTGSTGVSESVSPSVVLDWAWSAHSSDPSPDPCGRCQAFVPLYAAGGCRSAAASLSTPCVAWSLENSGHEENALTDDASVEETARGAGYFS